MKKEISDKPSNKNSQEETYEFLNKDVSRFLNCPSCKLLMKNPMRIHACGHTFCDKCAPSRGKCPECKQKIVAVQRDLVGQGLVNELFVKCMNGGCPFKGTFQDFKKSHQGNCKLQAGLDTWMQNMQNSLKQLGGPAKIKQRYSSDNQSSQNANFHSTSKQKQGGQKVSKPKISWEDEPFSKKQLRKQF